MDLLLEADPSTEKIAGYLPRSRCFRATRQDEVIGSYVLLPLGEDVYELMNIAVAPPHQGRGIGTPLLQHAIATARAAGARRLELGTGTFGYQLAFYQRAGFRATGVVRDFFTMNYPEPIHEDGIQHRDMLRLALEFRSEETAEPLR